MSEIDVQDAERLFNNYVASVNNNIARLEKERDEFADDFNKQIEAEKAKLLRFGIKPQNEMAVKLYRFLTDNAGTLYSGFQLMHEFPRLASHPSQLLREFIAEKKVMTEGERRSRRYYVPKVA